MIKIDHFIDGRRESGSSCRLHNVFNPATGESKKVVVLADPQDVNKAIESAKRAWPAWAETPSLRRARILDRFRAILWERIDILVDAISSEHGKTREDAKGEVIRGIEVVEFAAGIPHLIKGEFSDQVGTGVDSHSLRQSLGIVAGITPFNFPVMVPMWMFPIALACGNCFVLKPSERDPSASVLLAEWLTEAGLPDGVFNVVHGDKEAVDALLVSPDIKAVSFVGSTPIARYIYATGCAYGKRVQALGGAKNHMVIMPDADMEMAANALIGAAFGSAGERCMAISIAVPVTDAVADALVDILIPKIEALKVAPATNSDSDMGPLVTSEHLQKVRGYIDSGVEEGAELVIDGREFLQSQRGCEQGFYIGPSLFDRVTSGMKIYLEEIFGPVLCIVRQPDFQSSVNLINGHRYANGVSIFTRDGAVARTFERQIEVGMVGVNVPIPVPMAFHSFGGWKESFFGDHAMHGMEGVRFNTRIKTVTERWPSESNNQPDLVMPTLG